MGITINDKELKEHINAIVDQKIEAMTDETLKERIQDILFKRIDSLFGENGNTITSYTKQCVRDIIEKQMPAFNEEMLNEITNDISSKIATQLQFNIIESIAFRLAPASDDDEEDL